MNDNVANLLLALINLAISQARLDPVSRAKMDAGEPFTIDDLRRMGVARNEASQHRDDLINEASGD